MATVSCMIFGNALAFLIKPNTITENRKQEMEKRERYRPQATYLDWAGPPGPCQSPLTFASRQRRGTAHRRRARARATSCFPPLPRRGCERHAPPLDPLAPLPHSLLSPSPSAPSPEHTRAELIVADANYRGHCPSRASPMGPEEPPSPSASSTPTHSTAGAL